MVVLNVKSKRHQNRAYYKYLYGISWQSGQSILLWTKELDDWMNQHVSSEKKATVSLKYLFIFLINPLTALDLQRAGLRVQREAAEVHVAHGSDGDSAGKTAVTQRQQTKRRNRDSRCGFCA